MYCMAARNLLHARGVEFEEVRIGRSGPEFEAMRDLAGGAATVPQIFVGDSHIGGYEELADLDRQGQLDQILKNGKLT